jgi:hypothetical protein
MTPSKIRINAKQMDASMMVVIDVLRARLKGEKNVSVRKTIRAELRKMGFNPSTGCSQKGTGSVPAKKLIFSGQSIT